MFLSTWIIWTMTIVAILDLLANWPDSERQGLLKRLKFGRLTLLALIVLLVIQLVENSKNIEKEKQSEKLSTETHQGILYTMENVDSVLIKINLVVENALSEITILTDLNTEMLKARKGISASLMEYQKLNESYSAQLKIERDKVINAKPDVRILRPILTINEDSTDIGYQFILANNGQRAADSVEFSSIVVLMDSSNNFQSFVSDLKTNKGISNILNLTPNNMDKHYCNAILIPSKEKRNFGVGYLIVKYRYYDALTTTIFTPPISIFQFNTLDKINMQFAHNVPAYALAEIKLLFLEQFPDLHEVFFNQ